MAGKGEALTVVGGRELRKKLRAADGNLKDMSRVHRRISQVVLPHVQAAAPVWTGALRSTLKPSATTTQARIVAGGKPRGQFVKQRRMKDGSIRQYPAKPIDVVTWAGIVERRNPFIAPAILRAKPEWMPIYTAEVAGIADRINRG